MDLIDRYLESVRLLLPLDQREDIIAELRDVLTTRREEKAEALGRPLTRQEDEALLKAFGHPLKVAGRYGRQQYLIGPELYPVFIFVLRIVLACVIAGGLIAGLTQGVIAGTPPVTAIKTTIGTIWTGGFASLGIVTLIFAILQRQPLRERMLDDWNPRDLPRIAPRRRPRWYNHVAGIVVQALFLLWWTGALPVWWATIPVQPHGVLTLGLAPIWRVLYLPVILGSLAAIGVNAAKLAGVRGRAAHGLDVVLNAALAVMAAVALAAGHWVVFSASDIPAAALAKIDLGVNVGARVTLTIVLVTALATAGANLWRLWRPAAEPRRALNGA